jgi:hypothetical protein
MAFWPAPFWVLTEKRKGVETILTRSRVQEVKVAPSDFHDLLGLGFAISPECEEEAKSFETVQYINSRTSYVSRCRSASGDFGPFGPDTCRLNSNVIQA